MALSNVSEQGSSYDGITALPRWEAIQSPKRAHTRHESQDQILEKGVFTKEADLGATGDRSGANTPAEEENPRHSRMIVWLVLIVVIVLAMAIVLGAVLGTFINPGGSHAPEPSITEIPAGTAPTPSPTPTGGGDLPKTTSYAHLDSLAITGWSIPGDAGHFTVWIFSQDSDGYLSRHAFNSSTGNWTRVSNFASAKRGTPLAAAVLDTEFYKNQPNYDLPNAHYQVSIVYLTENNYLNEYIFPDSGPAIGQPGSLNQQKYIAHEETDIAFYWPSIIYQGMSGELRKAHFECYERGDCWQDDVLKTTEARNGTQLVTVPMRDNGSSMGLFYQEAGGRYVSYKEDNGQASQVWTNQAFSDLIAANSSVTAFSTTRPGDTDGDSNSPLNTYLIWQDVNGTIQTSWTDNNQGWKGPATHPAFANADNNTALTCLTGPTFPGFPLPTGTELARCYFQAGAAVREVSFNGTSWDVVGNVPTFGF